MRTEPLCITVNRSHPVASRRSLPVAAPAEEPFVMFPRNLAPGLHAQVMGICRRAGYSARVVQERRELYTSVRLVEAGVGVTILPASVEKLGWLNVRYRPIPGPSGITRIAAA